MSTPRARLVVAGLGRIGRLHAGNLAARVASAELVAVVDAVEPLARSVGELYGVGWFASLERALAESDLDGVVIATPTWLHPELVELAAGAGKHVFCEKPLGFEVEPSRRALAAARTAGVQLQVGFQRRFDPDWLALKEALDGGELGTLRLLRSSHRNARPAEAGDALGDVFVDLAIHDLDAARWLGGEVVEVFALAGRGVGETAAIALRFESGALGLVDVSRHARYGFECSVELVGSQATTRTGYAHRRREVELLRDGRASAPVPADHAQRHEAAYVHELEHFGELVMGRREPGSTGDDAVAALELARLAARSAELGVPLEAGAAGVSR
jgi:predicted dehydrogenase